VTEEVRPRPAQPRDREAVIDLIQILNEFEAGVTQDRLRGRAAATAYLRSLEERLARRSGRIVLADTDTGPVGLMSFAVEEDEPYVDPSLRRYGAVIDLVVREEWRSRGIGRMLLTEAERLTREAGLKRLRIGVLAGNEAAERLYRGNGFKPYALLLSKRVL
jgi:GNAT superfamily N-acetyltransferase